MGALGQRHLPSASDGAYPSLDSSAVTIDGAGFAEWRQVPVAGSIAISGATAWKLYDPDLNVPPIASGSGDGTAIVATAGSYLMLFGSPNATVKVSVAAAH